LRYLCVIVMGGETSSPDSFLEAIKKDYNYVKYRISADSDKLYYRFEFYR